jgi:hypothetical protein
MYLGRWVYGLSAPQLDSVRKGLTFGKKLAGSSANMFIATDDPDQFGLINR